MTIWRILTGSNSVAIIIGLTVGVLFAIAYITDVTYVYPTKTSQASPQSFQLAMLLPLTIPGPQNFNADLPNNETVQVIQVNSVASAVSPVTATADTLEVPNLPIVQDISEKMILLWQHEPEDPYGPPYPLDGSNWPTDCGERLKCSVTNDRSHASSADAIFISWRFTNSSDLPDPKSRSPQQRYVFYAVEAPTRWRYSALDYAPNPKFKDYFNWTMTYRTDSDIYTPYGIIERRSVPIDAAEWNSHIQAKIGTKSKLAAALITSCVSASRRERLLESIQAAVQIDIFGCSGKSCPATPPTTCRAALERDYFFYFAFENSVCRDYVTEKAFFQLEIDIVPIVLSRHVTSAAGIPDEAFIAVDDFETIPQLVGHLMSLFQNTAAYANYFEWKRFHKSVPTLQTAFDSPFANCPMCRLLRAQAAQTSRTDEVYKFLTAMGRLFDWTSFYHHRELEPVPFEKAFCGLCEALHNQSLPNKIIPDITDWWVAQSQCSFVSVDQNLTIRSNPVNAEGGVPWIGFQ